MFESCTHSKAGLSPVNAGLPAYFKLNVRLPVNDARPVNAKIPNVGNGVSPQNLLNARSIRVLGSRLLKVKQFKKLRQLPGDAATNGG